MNTQKFAEELVGLMPPINAEFVRRQPKEVMKGRMSITQMVIMDVLRIVKESKMGDLSETLGVTKSAVTGLTDRLISVGLLKRSRSKKDRRIVKVKLTPHGMRLAKTMYEHKVKMVSDLFSSISTKEKEAYLKILRKLRENILSRKERKKQ